MENQRTLLYITFFFLLFLIWQAWQQDYGPKPVAVVESGTTAQNGMPAINDTPTAVALPDSVPQARMVEAVRQPVHVVTDNMDLYIDTRGGTIYRLDLRHYPQDADNKDIPFALFSDKESQLHIAQSGLISSASPAPNHHAIYHAQQTEYRLAEGVDELSVELFWQEADVRVKKRFIFKRNSYVIEVQHQVQSASDWSGSQYQQLSRADTDTRGESTFIYTYTGGVIYNDDLKYEKVNFSDMADKDLGLEMKGGWIAMIQHYFLAAWIPDQTQTGFTYSKHPSSNRYLLGTRSPLTSVAAGEQANFSSKLVVGPKLQYELAEVSPGLDLTVDYGVLTILAKPLFWILKQYHTLFDNWGWAIIFLTITVKLIFYKLSE
ncbi:MAG: membrane protein insertase YidC, partial [Gammaproteobacteria bacterium]|nr:membrane protein insertase YidC [Gammaproteobacteria bacterium]